MVSLVGRGPTSDHSEMFAVSSDWLAQELQNLVTICLKNDAHAAHKAQDFANKSGNKSCFQRVMFALC